MCLSSARWTDLDYVNGAYADYNYDAASRLLRIRRTVNAATRWRRKGTTRRSRRVQLDRLDLPLGRCRITFRVRSRPDLRFLFNSLRLERLQK